VDLVENEMVVVFGDPGELDVCVADGRLERLDSAGAGVPRADDDSPSAHARGCGVDR
jgi:hypothetical protein